MQLARPLMRLKQMLLATTVVYFYLLAFTLLLHLPTLGLDSPSMFLVMVGLFVGALCLEAVFAWWRRRLYLLWFVLGIVSYGILGLYVAPTLYGTQVLLYVLLEPLVIVFIGGFAFSYGHVFAEHLFGTIPLTPEQINVLLRELPGWTSTGAALKKTYTCTNFSAALRFVNHAAVIVQKTHHYPEAIRLQGACVTVVLSTRDTRGVTLTDIHHAKKFDAI